MHSVVEEDHRKLWPISANGRNSRGIRSHGEEHRDEWPLFTDGRNSRGAQAQGGATSKSDEQC